MHEWTQERQFEQDGLVITIQVDAGHYPERLVSVTKNGILVDHARVPWNVWDGHQNGTLWLPGYIEHMKAKVTQGQWHSPDPSKPKP